MKVLTVGCKNKVVLIMHPLG